MQNTRYTLTSKRPGISFKACVVADLHDRSYGHILPILKAERPDFILLPGDITEQFSDGVSSPRPGLELLAECAAIAPSFYALGNHEIGGCHHNIREAKRAERKPDPFVVTLEIKGRIESTGVVLLYQSYTVWNGLVIGGLGSGLLNPGWIPDLDWLEDYVKTPGYKLLMSHHPEYYDRYLRPYDIDLTVSGHAHGGQWRVFGRGVYAPDQKLFPKYTSGVHEGRLVISRGVANSVPVIPRFFNPCEVVTVTVKAD
ncbi:MAG: metallophosphoesterase [Clostridia bacterium]|nr:metallophosphoesterase [Clostridia bacterium]